MPFIPQLTHSVYSDLIEDKRKWYQVWLDNFLTLDYTDLLPILFFSGGPAYYFILGGVFAMFSLSTAGIGLGVIATGTIGWQLLKYPIKRICANIAGLVLTETPKWGLHTPASEKVATIVSNEIKGEIEEDKRQLRLFSAKLEKISKENNDMSEQLVTLRRALVRQTEQSNLNQQIYETRNTQAMTELSSMHEEQIEQLKLDYELKIRDLKHEHKKTLRALTHQLNKSNRTYEKLRTNYAKLTGNEKLLSHHISLPSYSSNNLTHFKPRPNDDKGPEESATFSDSSISPSLKSNSDTD